MAMFPDEIEVIHNGVDFNRMKKTGTGRMLGKNSEKAVLLMGIV